MRAFIIKLISCKVFKWHVWTSKTQQGIKPTKEELNSGIEGFAAYAEMYCARCGHISEFSKDWIKELRNKYKNLNL